MSNAIAFNSIINTSYTQYSLLTLRFVSFSEQNKNTRACFRDPFNISFGYATLFIII